MAIIATHNKVDSQPDDPSVAMAGGVVPSDWNAEHVVNIEDGTFTQQMFAEGVLPDQDVNTTSDVTFDFLQLNREEGLQLSGDLNANFYFGQVARGTNGYLLETETGDDGGIYIRPGGDTFVAVLPNGQIVLGGEITPLTAGVNPAAVSITNGDFAVQHYSWFQDTLYGLRAEWECAGTLNAINFVEKNVNTRVDPDSMVGTGVGHSFKQYYYDAVPDEADIGATTWFCEGNWTIDPTTRNSTMVLQNVKNGVLQDVLTIDSDGNATIPGTFTSAAIVTTIIDGINQTYGTVVDGVYYVIYKAPYAGTINSLSHIVRSLTTAGTVNVQINGVDVTGLIGIVPTVSGNTTSASADNTFVAGDSISLLFASTLGIVDFQYTLNITRATS